MFVWNAELKYILYKPSEKHQGQMNGKHENYNKKMAVKCYKKRLLLYSGCVPNMRFGFESHHGRPGEMITAYGTFGKVPEQASTTGIY